MRVDKRTRLSLVAMMLVLALSLLLWAVPASAGDCGECGGCGCCGCCVPVGSPGYFKKEAHWPEGVEDIEVGGDVYSKAAAIGWLKEPVRGDKSVTLFRALVAAKLNMILNENCCSYTWCIKDFVEDADAWVAAHPPGSGVKANTEAWQCGGEDLYMYLDAYNNGYWCAPGRD